MQFAICHGAVSFGILYQKATAKTVEETPTSGTEELKAAILPKQKKMSKVRLDKSDSMNLEKLFIIIKYQLWYSSFFFLDIPRLSII